jgi:ergothioneine biosynthesis protein EgtB
MLGLNHEQQHQELLLTDIKHAFGSDPLRPTYREQASAATGSAPPLLWLTYPAGERWVGHAGGSFAFDNETPRHRQLVGPFQLASRLVTNGEYLAFVADGGYDRPECWLSDGWDACRAQSWAAPLYWERQEGRWLVMTLAGLRPLDEAEPVCHVSYYEAEAFARWSDARLPTEAEWEAAATGCTVRGNLLETGRLHPAPLAASADSAGPAQLFGDVWEWTGSPYVAYPGYRPAAGALGEYNGKFMCNQLVLRGGSCATPPGHIRPTYRNFFPPPARWQFTGIRLAKDI